MNWRIISKDIDHPDIAKTKCPSKGKEGVFENYRMFISYFSTSVEDKGGR